MSSEKKKMKNSIAARRKEMGLSQENLAELLEISVTQLSRLERGESSLGQARAHSIAEVLKVRPEELFQTSNTHGGIQMDSMFEVVKQLDEMINRLELTVSPTQRAGITIQFYKLEIDRISASNLSEKDVDLSRYEPVIRTLVT